MWNRGFPPPPHHPDPMIDISSHCCLLPASIAIRPAISVPTYHQLGSCVPTYHQLGSMWTISPHYLCKYLGLLWASAFIFHHYRSVNTTTTTTNCGNLWEILSLRDFSKTWVFPSKPESWPIQTTHIIQDITKNVIIDSRFRENSMWSKSENINSFDDIFINEAFC